MRGVRLVGVLVCVAAACSHDLDSLREEAVDRAGSDASGAGGDGMGGEGGQDPPPQACEPCPALPALAETLGVRRCCRGALGRECGITLGEAAICLPAGQEGRADSECAGARLDVLNLQGCCRPDGRCGIDAPEVGCVAREDLPAAFPNASEPMACSFECSDDADCGDDGALVCVDDEAAAARVCARSCERDGDCGASEICGPRNDATNGRVVAMCQPPIGDARPGAACAMPRDCERGWCVDFGGPMTRCTLLCTAPSDCPDELPSCVSSAIQGTTPEELQDFRICAP